jgi:hypothetical protein
MAPKKRHDSSSHTTTTLKRLLLLLAIGSATVGLLRAIDPHWLDLWVQLVERILTRRDSYDG